MEGGCRPPDSTIGARVVQSADHACVHHPSKRRPVVMGTRIGTRVWSLCSHPPCGAWVVPAGTTRASVCAGSMVFWAACAPAVASSARWRRDGLGVDHGDRLGLSAPVHGGSHTAISRHAPRLGRQGPPPPWHGQQRVWKGTPHGLLRYHRLPVWCTATMRAKRATGLPDTEGRVREGSHRSPSIHGCVDRHGLTRCVDALGQRPRVETLCGLSHSA